jgi:hypothetical protein
MMRIRRCTFSSNQKLVLAVWTQRRNDDCVPAGQWLEHGSNNNDAISLVLAMRFASESSSRASNKATNVSLRTDLRQSIPAVATGIPVNARRPGGRNLNARCEQIQFPAPGLQQP